MSISIIELAGAEYAEPITQVHINSAADLENANLCNLPMFENLTVEFRYNYNGELLPNLPARKVLLMNGSKFSGKMESVETLVITGGVVKNTSEAFPNLRTLICNSAVVTIKSLWGFPGDEMIVRGGYIEPGVVKNYDILSLRCYDLARRVSLCFFQTKIRNLEFIDCPAIEIMSTNRTLISLKVHGLPRFPDSPPRSTAVINCEFVIVMDLRNVSIESFGATEVFNFMASNSDLGKDPIYTYNAIVSNITGIVGSTSMVDKSSVEFTIADSDAYLIVNKSLTKTDIDTAAAQIANICTSTAKMVLSASDETSD